MSRFYAEIEGSRGRTSRQGTPKSGMWSHTRGWNVGVKVQCFVNKDGEDECRIYKTGGSNHSSQDEFIVSVTKEKEF